MPNFIQKALTNGSSTPASSLAIVFGSNFLTGNTIVGAFQYTFSAGAVGDISSISDGTNSYSVVDFLHTTNSENVATFKGIAAAGKNTITVTLAATHPNFGGMAHEVGQVTANVDVHAIHEVTASSAPTSGSVTPTSPQEYIYAACTAELAAPASWAAGGSFTLQNSSLNASTPMADEFLVQGAAAAIAGTFGVGGSSSSYITAILTLFPGLMGAALL